MAQGEKKMKIKEVVTFEKLKLVVDFIEGKENIGKAGAAYTRRLLNLTDATLTESNYTTAIISHRFKICIVSTTNCAETKEAIKKIVDIIISEK